MDRSDVRDRWYRSERPRHDRDELPVGPERADRPVRHGRDHESCAGDAHHHAVAAVAVFRYSPSTGVAPSSGGGRASSCTGRTAATTTRAHRATHRPRTASRAPPSARGRIEDDVREVGSGVGSSVGSCVTSSASGARTMAPRNAVRQRRAGVVVVDERRVQRHLRDVPAAPPCGGAAPAAAARCGERRNGPRHRPGGDHEAPAGSCRAVVRTAASRPRRARSGHAAACDDGRVGPLEQAEPRLLRVEHAVAGPGPDLPHGRPEEREAGAGLSPSTSSTAVTPSAPAGRPARAGRRCPVPCT